MIPVWGFGTVSRSRNIEVPEGQRFYGYFPMQNKVTFQPSRVTEHGLVVPRSDPGLSALYNSFINTGFDAWNTGPKCEAAMT
jgi:hypothetical protein